MAFRLSNGLSCYEAEASVCPWQMSLSTYTVVRTCFAQCIALSIVPK